MFTLKDTEKKPPLKPMANPFGNGWANQYTKQYKTIRVVFWVFRPNPKNHHPSCCVDLQARSSFLVLLSWRSFFSCGFQNSLSSFPRVIHKVLHIRQRLEFLAMPVHYEPHVKTKACPKCGKQRPLDWYNADGAPCWKCRGLSWKDKQTPEDGLLGSIRKRSHGKHAKGANDDLIG
ncbi:hypothetical protein [Adlercreutzia sp.]|jgi:hypothetical protein|uniref:hypothetical protein n=1 Tax=Adlercreutzia sp. TaxID=1872387 RepID=UPI003A840639